MLGRGRRRRTFDHVRMFRKLKQCSYMQVELQHQVGSGPGWHKTVFKNHCSTLKPLSTDLSAFFPPSTQMLLIFPIWAACSVLEKPLTGWLVIFACFLWNKWKAGWTRTTGSLKLYVGGLVPVTARVLNLPVSHKDLITSGTRQALCFQFLHQAKLKLSHI